MQLKYPKLLFYSGLLLVIAMAQLVLLVKVISAPSHDGGFGLIFLIAFVSSQILLSLAGLVMSFRPRPKSAD